MKYFRSLILTICSFFKYLNLYCRLATVASGAASGKLLQYEVGGPKVSVQTAYGVEVEVGRRIPLFFLLSFLPTDDLYKILESC